MTEKQFDAIAYFKQLTEENVTCRLYNFVATTCSGPDTVQGVMQQFRRTANFVMVSDTVDSNTHSVGDGFFDRNVFTVWLLAAYKQDDMADREQKLNIADISSDSSSAVSSMTRSWRSTMTSWSSSTSRTSIPPSWADGA